MEGRLAFPPEVWFVSLGLVVLDEIHFASGKVFEDVVGGSAAYSE